MKINESNLSSAVAAIAIMLAGTCAHAAGFQQGVAASAGAGRTADPAKAAATIAVTSAAFRTELARMERRGIGGRSRAPA